MSIAIEQCTFTYPGTHIGVHDVSISAAPGELVAVIGASGSGKTTMLKLVAGFEHADKGIIRINDKDVSNVPARRRNVGVVFQSYALFPLMSCRDNVAYPLKIRGMNTTDRRHRALEMLDRVGLATFADRLPGSMSGGQQQRVALARALVFHPDVLLLDEPLSALDAGLRVELRTEIRRLQKELGISALHVTHDQEEALSMADKVALMHQGRLIQIASPREMYDAPNCRRVAAFVGHANLWDATVLETDRVSVPFGELRCSTTGWNRGDTVTVLARPERIQIDPPSNALNSFAGTTHADVFLGAVRRYTFTVDHPNLPESEKNPINGHIQGETSARQPFSRVAIPPDTIRLLPPGDVI